MYVCIVYNIIVIYTDCNHYYHYHHHHHYHYGIDYIIEVHLERSYIRKEAESMIWILLESVLGKCVV